MNAADVNGTASQPAGWTFIAGKSMTLEPAAGLSVTVHVAAGAPVERLDVDGNDEPAGGTWRKYDPGAEFVVGDGQRVMLRPRGGGGAAVGFTWNGDERLAALGSYTGGKGQDPYSA